VPIYKLDPTGKFIHFESTPFPDLERKLEDWIESNPHLLIEGEDLIIAARQPRTSFGKALDLLAIDETGAAVVVELKRGEAPREVVAQALEYAAWVDSLSLEQLNEMARDYALRRGLDADGLDDLYRMTFVDAEDDDDEEAAVEDDEARRVTFNNRQRIVIVAERISDEVEQTLRYLRTRHNVDVFGITFSVHVAGSDTIINTTTVVGRERAKPPATTTPPHQETVEETLERVQSEFLRTALPGMEDWAAGVEGLSIVRAARGSTRRVAFKGRRWLYYYFAANWMYVLLFRVSESEVAVLREKLSDPSTIEPRRGGLHARFHVKNDADLRLLQDIILARIAAASPKAARAEVR
jgi:predicted nucleic acid-binding protein